MSRSLRRGNLPLDGRRLLILADNECAPDPRINREAIALAEAGAVVDLIAWQREGEAPECESRDGVSVHRLGPASGRNRRWQQLRPLLDFYRRASKAAPQPVAGVMAHDFLMLPLGAYLAWRLDAKLIYDAHEIYRWMEDGRLPHWWLRAANRLERSLITRAVDLFITVSSQRASAYWTQQVQTKPVVVGNWYDPVAVDIVAVRDRYQFGRTGRRVVGYAGTLNRNRRIDLLLGLAELRSDVEVVIAGRGTAVVVAAIEDAAARLDNVRYLGWVTDGQAVLGACDAIYYAIDPSHAYFGFAAPNTLYSAIALNRPLLGLAGGEVAEVSEASNGVIRIAEASVEALSRGVDQLDAWGGWGDIRTRYTWQAARAQLVSAVDAVLAG